MTRTVLESKTKTVVIGFDQPFCVIGERINPTGRKKLAAELEVGDFSTVERDAVEQVACGAAVLDINAGAVFSNKMAEDPRYADNNFVEPPLMKEIVERVQALVDVPLCIDSSVPGALQTGLETAHGRPLLNSVTGEEERLELVLPLVKKYNVPGHLERRHRHLREPGRPLRGRQEDRRACGGPWHPGARHRRRPAGHAGRRHGNGGAAGLHTGPPAARGAGRQHHLRRLEHLVRPAEPARNQQRLSADGGRRRHDVCHHEPRPGGRVGQGHGRARRRARGA